MPSYLSNNFKRKIHYCEIKKKKKKAVENSCTICKSNRQKFPSSGHVTGVRWARAEWELRRAGWTTLGLSNPLVRWRLPWARDHVNIEQLQWWAARWSSSRSLTYLHGLNRNTSTVCKKKKTESRVTPYFLLSHRWKQSWLHPWMWVPASIATAELLLSSSLLLWFLF